MNNWPDRFRRKATPVVAVRQAIDAIKGGLITDGEFVTAVAAAAGSTALSADRAAVCRSADELWKKVLPAVEAETGLRLIVEIGPCPYLRVVPDPVRRTEETR